MPEVARTISLRLAPRHIEALKARAHTVSGTLTGVARELILTGLAGDDNKALGERLMQIERRLAALEGLAHDMSDTARHIDSVTGELRDKFNALLNALSFPEVSNARGHQNVFWFGRDEVVGTLGGSED